MAGTGGDIISTNQPWACNAMLDGQSWWKPKGGCLWGTKLEHSAKVPVLSLTASAVMCS